MVLLKRSLIELPQIGLGHKAKVIIVGRLCGITIAAKFQIQIQIQKALLP